MVLKMNILMIGPYKPKVGGVSHVVQALAKQFSSDHNVFVVDIGDGGVRNGFGYWKDYNIDVYTERFYPVNYLYLPIQMIIQTTKRAMLLRKRADLYHTHGEFYSGIGFIDKRKPLVLTMHGYPALEQVASGRIKPNSIQFKFIMWVTKKVVQRADAVIAVDSTLENWIRTSLDCNTNKLFVVPNGVDTKKFDFNGINSTEIDRIRKNYGLKDNQKLIVCIRRFAPKNGVENVLEGFIEYLTRNKDSDAVLLLGGGGPLKSDFENKIKKHNLKNKIILEDTILHDNIPSYYNAADIILNSFTHIPFVEEFPVHSVKEALKKGRPICTSLTTVEALSMGKPVILSTVGGTYKRVDFNDFGVIVSDKNPKEISDAIEKILDNYEKAKEMGINAREYIVNNRDWAVIANKVMNVYNFAIENQTKK
ncbi:MAG: hypothetical protein CVT88_03315 [Candidatus Altiarchaeales archaeon HGW-Altiarchaeales-1]|nr:MAG: hypothetical protein CVT88_03315 [Candidatus Altiarchaeales archaeon HGW-Altiarchaeales-1]